MLRSLVRQYCYLSHSPSEVIYHLYIFLDRFLCSLTNSYHSRYYDSCYQSFDWFYPKPYCPKCEKEKGCYKYEWKNDDCGKQYGG